MCDNKGLNLGSFDPYPELQGPSCNYARNIVGVTTPPADKPKIENYDGCARYSNGQRACTNVPLISMNNSAQLVAPVRENYSVACCNTNPYYNLQKTWVNQKPFST
jgi:hypothetical protein